MNACGECGPDPPLGECGVSYACVHGSCGASGACECEPGYLGFVCEHGRGVCPDQFGCGEGACGPTGVCSCPGGRSGHDCSVAMSADLSGGGLAGAELQALTDLFHATGGEAWHIKSGWLSAKTPCEGGPKGLKKGWRGIICDEELLIND